jgi:hypothetical protein
MPLSTKLQERLNAQRLIKEQTRKRHQNLYNISVALGLTAGIVAFAYGAQSPSNTLPSTPALESDWRTKVSYSESVPAEQLPQLPAPVVANDAKPVVCNPYVNGVYIGDLCGDHDAFADKADRAIQPSSDWRTRE